jgi:hypothetical protein
MTPLTHRPIRDRRLLITVFYDGPWSKLETFCLGIHRDNRDETRWSIPMDPTGWRRLLGAIADWAERRDHAWIERYAFRGVNPPERWRRK